MPLRFALSLLLALQLALVPLAQRSSAALAATGQLASLAAGGDAEDTALGGTIAASAYQNNYLNHNETLELATKKAQLKECQNGTTVCDAEHVVELHKDIEALDNQNYASDKMLRWVCDNGSTEQCNIARRELQVSIDSFAQAEGGSNEGPFNNEEAQAAYDRTFELQGVMNDGLARALHLKSVGGDYSMPIDSQATGWGLFLGAHLAVGGVGAAATVQAASRICGGNPACSTAIASQLFGAEIVAEFGGGAAVFNQVLRRTNGPRNLSPSLKTGHVETPATGSRTVPSKPAPQQETNKEIIAKYSPISEGPLHNDIAKTFRSGTYNEIVATEPTKLYRVISDNGNAAGGYWTRTKPQGPVQSVIDSALDQGWKNPNSATTVIEMNIPTGTKFFEGVAAPQGSLTGGGNQIYFDPIINTLNPDWIK